MVTNTENQKRQKVEDSQDFRMEKCLGNGYPVYQQKKLKPEIKDYKTFRQEM